ncbi:hypothetical protein IT407_02640 [Candidatus Uhrbacteria bacterium]|nr:hypothetical protein [Candidatus Uhrbacteria bacterium]
MTSRNWYRKTTWSKADQEDFEKHFSRARGVTKPQALTIQAHHLIHDIGTRDAINAGIGLIDRMLKDYSADFENARAYDFLGDANERLGNFDSALVAYSLSLDAQRKCPGITGQVHLSFGDLVARLKIKERYEEALNALKEFGSNDQLTQKTRFMHESILARILYDLGEAEKAKLHALNALKSAYVADQFFTKEKGIGKLSNEDYRKLEKEIRQIANS